MFRVKISKFGVWDLALDNFVDFRFRLWGSGLGMWGGGPKWGQSRRYFPNGVGLVPSGVGLGVPSDLGLPSGVISSIP